MCEEHFETSCYRKTKVRKLLLPDAVPTKINVSNPPDPKTSTRRPPKNRSTPLECPSQVQTTVLSVPSTSLANISIGPETSFADEKTTSLKRKLQNERSRTSRLRKKIKLQDNLQDEAKELTEDNELDKVEEILKKYLPDETSSFVLTQLRVAQLPSRARRWTYKEKSSFSTSSQ